MKNIKILLGIVICSGLIFSTAEAVAQNKAQNGVQSGAQNGVQSAAQKAEQKEAVDPDVKYGSELLKPGTDAPDFRLKTPDGKEVSLSDFRGKYVVLDFWASWCGDCRRDLPNVKAAYEKYSPKGVVFIGVSFDDSAERWKSAIKEFGLEYPQVSELKKWKTTDINAAYKLKWIPTIYIIGPDGKVALATVLSERLEQFLHNLYYVK